MKKGSTYTKSKYYATEIYEDSTPDMYVPIKYLKSHFVRMVISPNHNQDVWDKDIPERNIHIGDSKKAHRHIYMLFNEPKTENQVKLLLKDTTCVGVEAVYDKIKFFEYLWHKNEIDKVHYNEKDLIFIDTNKQEFEKYDNVMNEITDFIFDNEIHSMSQLVKYIKEIDTKDYVYLKTIQKYAYFINTLLKGD